MLYWLEKYSDTKPNLTRYTSGGFDIVVDVRPAENYNDGHITGAYNHPGLAFLPSTDDLIPNLGDCKTKNVAVPCARFELRPFHPSQFCSRWWVIVNLHSDPSRDVTRPSNVSPPSSSPMKASWSSTFGDGVDCHSARS